MASEHSIPSDPDQPMICHLRIKGHLGPHWTGWFEGLAITREDNGQTLLSGPVVDQPPLWDLHEVEWHKVLRVRRPPPRQRRSGTALIQARLFG